jgi:hypothetical protein
VISDKEREFADIATRLTLQGMLALSYRDYLSAQTHGPNPDPHHHHQPPTITAKGRRFLTRLIAKHPMFWASLRSNSSNEQNRKLADFVNFVSLVRHNMACRGGRHWTFPSLGRPVTAPCSG